MSARSKFGGQLASKPSSPSIFSFVAKQTASQTGRPLSPAICASLLRLWNDIATGRGPLPSLFDPNSPSSAPWALCIAHEESDIAVKAALRLSQPATLFCFRVLEALVGGKQQHKAPRPSDAVFLASAVGECIKALRTKSAMDVEDALVKSALANQRSSRLPAESFDALERALTSTIKARFSSEYINAEDVERVWACGIEYMRPIVVQSRRKSPPCIVM